MSVKNKIPVFDCPGIVRAHLEPFWQDIALVFGCHHPDGSFTALANFQRVRVAAHEPIQEAAYLNIAKDSAQVLMDDLWRCGIRPTEGEGSAGSFAAQAKHLQDMRAIVEKTTGVQFK